MNSMQAVWGEGPWVEEIRQELAEAGYMLLGERLRQCVHATRSTNNPVVTIPSLDGRPLRVARMISIISMTIRPVMLITGLR